MSPIKEPRFFAAPDPERPFGGPRIARLSEYESLFDCAAAVRGEASPGYSQHPWRPGVPERIHELVPEAKFIYLVGDPVKRVISHYKQAVTEQGEERSISTALSDVEEPEQPFVCPGRYALQVERYLAVFPRERMLVIDQNDLLNHRRSTLQLVFAFLGVDADHWNVEFELIRNRSSDHRRVSSGLYGCLRDSGLRTAVRRLPTPMRTLLVAPVRHILAQEVDEPLLDAALRQRLEDHYRPEVERLRAITGRPFGGWSL